MEELKRYLLDKIKELQKNEYKKYCQEYTSGCIDMCTEIFDKIAEIEDYDEMFS